METMTQRARNRTLLHRQHLLTPTPMGVEALVHHLGGLQAQERLGPYMGLWARMASFTLADLDSARQAQRVVRATLQRGTVHMPTLEDFRRWHPFYRAKTEATLKAKGYPLAQNWRATFMEELGDRPLATKDLRQACERLLGLEPDPYHPLFRAVFYGLGLIRTHGPEGKSLGPQEKWVFFEHATGQGFEEGSMEALIRRYLGAFGPATPADFAHWAGLPSQRKLFEKLSDELWRGKGEQGQVLYDLPEAERLTGTEAAPSVQLLADFDNLILGHAERSHIVSLAHRDRMNRNLRVMCPILVEGYFAGVWEVRQTKKAATAKLEPYIKVSKRQKQALIARAEEALGLIAPDQPHEVTWL